MRRSESRNRGKVSRSVCGLTDTETIHKIRNPGYYARNPGGDVHMEYAGPQGSLVFFSTQAVDDQLFEVLSKDQKVLALPTFEDFVAGRLPH